jgi:hypothetical protein
MQRYNSPSLLAKHPGHHHHHLIIVLEIIITIITRLVPKDETSFVELRIGIHCGEMVTGLSGNLRPHYCCFGDTVCVAARYDALININIIVVIYH